MTPSASRKASERQRRKERGEVADVDAIKKLLREKADFYNRRANEALSPGLADERRHTAEALEAICLEVGA